ncbi:MAG: hypothetical protein ACNA8W_00575, partial [Bradymonadaceae bacterium]
ADHDDHAGTYIEADLLNWQQGMRRLVLGAFMADAESCKEERPFVLGPNAYLPLEHSQTELHASARLNLLVQSLISDARFLKKGRLPLRQWAQIMADMIRVYLDVDDPADTRELMKCHELLGELAEADLSGEAVSFRMAWDFARAKLETLEGRRGQYLADGVVVSSFLPMRPIPFKVVFITGMGEGKFPAPERLNPLDLRQVKWKEGDVRHREQEKYMFLETLISTRERLYLSWVSRDARTGESLMPSSVVRELQYILQGFEGGKAIAARVIEPPLRRYDGAYFPELFGGLPEDEPGLHKNYHHEAHEEARLKALREDLQRFCTEYSLPFPDIPGLKSSPNNALRGLLENPLRLHEVQPRPADDEAGGERGGPKISVSFWHLRRFLECPLQATAGLLVGLREEEEEDYFAIENEIFETSSMHRAGLLREVFLKTILEASSDNLNIENFYRQKARLLELRGILPTGVFLETERLRHMTVLKYWRQNLEHFGVESALQIRRFGRSSERVRVTDVLDSIRLEVPLADGTLIEVELYGESQAMSQDSAISVSLLPRPGLRDKDFLPGFLDHLFLAAAGKKSDGAPWRILVNTAQDLSRKKSEALKAMRVVNPMGQEESRLYLTTLLAEMLGRIHDYLLPIEAVVDFIAHDFQGMGRITEELLGKRGMCSSEYGPVRRVHDFSPMGDTEARRVVEQRFKPLLELFGGRR